MIILADESSRLSLITDHFIFCYTQYMIIFFHSRIRIGIVLALSFFISGFIMKYTQESPSEMAPQIQIQTITADVSQSLSNSETSIISALQSFKLPTLVSFVPPASQPAIPSKQPVEPTPLDWEIEPSGPTEIPTSTPAILPTNGPLPTNIAIPTTAKPTIHVVTQPPQPTKTPKPTKIPKPTELILPPILTDVRPGTSIEEIARAVSKRTCVPYALLMAIRTKETGAWFNNMNAASIKMINTYGWWKSANKYTVCTYLAFYTQSRLIPPDSTVALAESPKCNGNPFPGTDQKIMGIMQVNEAEQNGVLNQIKNIIPQNVDRRILFDNMTIFATITKNRAGKNPHSDCNDWPETTVKEVARIHHGGSSGVCKYSYSGGPSGDYCKEVWDLYKSFK